MRKTISLLLSVFLLFNLMLTGCSAAETDKTIVLKIGNPIMTVNGEEKPIDDQGTAPAVINDRTLLPVRAVIEELGGNVEWNGEKQEVTLKYGEDEIRLKIDSTAAYLNNEAQTLDTAPTAINDRTMLPIRFIAESFNFGVKWDGAEQTVTVTKSKEQSTEPAKPAENTETEPKSLVVYFSATGNTKALAEKIAAVSGADIFEIVPETPYSSDDLNYNNNDCRANKEHNDDNARPAISGKLENIEDYSTVFIGYPIWWGTMPKIINTFLETYDLSGKTIMPFCTSGGSGISTSVSAIKTAVPNADVKDGLRGTSGTSDDEIKKWIE